MDNHPLLNSIPYKLIVQENVLLKWLYVKDKQFIEPFFDETISKCLSFDENSKRIGCVTTAEELIAAAATVESIYPSAFIFHVSRCGSTLLSQLLSLDEEHIVLSEVPLLDELLRVQYRANLAPSLAEEAFRASIVLMGQKRTGNEKHLFVKLDSWHIFYYQTIRKLYPEVPFILLYRSPAEIVRSHHKKRGMQMVPGMIQPELLGFTHEEISGIDLDDYTAKVLERFYAQFIKVSQEDNNALLVDYNEGIMNIISRMARHTGIEFSEGSLRRMHERSGYHSKHPGQTFSEDENILPGGAWLSRAEEMYRRIRG